MRRAALTGVLIAGIAACAPRPDQQLNRLYESATTQLWRGELTGASKDAAEGARLAGTLPEWSWRFRLLDAEIRLVSREIPQAADLLKQSPPGSFPWGVAKQRYLEGQLALLQGRAAEASAILDDVKRRAQLAAAWDVALDVGALAGQALFVQRKWAEAEAVLNETVAQARQRGDRYHEAVALVNLGTGQLIRDRFDHALEFFERVLAQKDLEPQLVYSVALTNAGICYYRLGDLTRAVDAQRRAVASYERPGRPRVYYQRALGELGNTYLMSGDLPNGIAYAQRALDVAKASKLNDAAALWAANLAVAYLRKEDWMLAERANDESRQLAAERPDLSVNRTLTDAEIAAGRGRSEDATRLFHETLAAARTRPSLQWSAYEGLGRLAMATKRGQDAERNFAAALDVIERTRSDLLKADYRLSFLTRLIRFYQQYIDLLVDRGQVERALAIADSSRGRVLAERQGVSAPGRLSSEAFRRGASELGAVLLFYWVGNDRSYVWCVTPQRLSLIPLSVNEERLTAMVRAYQQSIVSSLADPLANAHGPGDDLYATLIAPVSAHVARGGRVVIVPDAALNTLNFETLPVPGERRHYWIEDVTISVAPSLATLNTSVTAGGPRDRSVLLIGDAVPADSKYPSLKYASAEIAAVAGAFADRAAVYRADQATPAQYRASQPGRFEMVHFTAHADANTESPLDSAVILSRGQTGYKLYARDVAEQPLNAELVTISACRSAGERTYAGEGLVGFSWAFLRAGAKRVIAGLWDVDDRSTAELMGRVYQKIAEGMSPGGALRAAKLEMIAKGGAASKPYYWGPFELFIGSKVIP